MFLMRGCSGESNVFEYVINLFLHVKHVSKIVAILGYPDKLFSLCMKDERDCIHKKAVKMGDRDLMNTYKIKINYVALRIRQAQITYYKKSLTDNKLNSLKVLK